jgi:Lrp/AsnC family transcriptional regulator for asnA, asnC and gidA
MIRISEKDRHIIERLRKNARTPFTKIAEELGVTEAAIRKRVRKLEEGGVIKGYVAEVDPKKMGYNVTVFLGFDVEPEHYTKVVEKVKAMPQVRRLYSTTGDHMFMAECWFKDRDELNVFVKFLEAIPGVTRVCPAIVVERIK